MLLSDTVGFIQKLPTSLVAAFRATLEEVVEADVLLEVVDATHPNAIEQSETVNDVLEELGAAEKPRVTALNKIDLLEHPEDLDTSLFPNAVPVSAIAGTNLETLLMTIGSVLSEGMVRMRVHLPFERGDLVELFHRRGQVLREAAGETGTRIEGLLPAPMVGVFARLSRPDSPRFACAGKRGADRRRGHGRPRRRRTGGRGEAGTRGVGLLSQRRQV